MRVDKIKAFNQNGLHLYFTGEWIKDPEGNLCPVLDIDKLNFDQAPIGERKEPIQVVCVGENGHITAQSFEGGLETFSYHAQEGDALFINSSNDIYVPPCDQGGRLKFKDLAVNGYQILSNRNGVASVKSPPAKLLIGVIDRRVCIKNAWGDSDIPEDHQFLSKGATLKKSLHSGKVTGIDPQGFKKWVVLKKNTADLKRVNSGGDGSKVKK